MGNISRFAMVGAVGAGLAGCAAPPMGPTVQVLPGNGKSFEAFTYDQADCKNYAASQVSGQAEAANTQGIGAAALTTVLGAGLGAAIGGGRGAAIGAGSGAVVGTGIGASGSSRAQYSIQVQYNNAFSQCMYAKGNQVPGYQAMISQTPANLPPPPPVASGPGLVAAVQTELNRLNYMRAPADGVLGQQTSSAIASFERSNGLPVDGVPSPQLLARLQATPTGAGSTASY